MKIQEAIKYIKKYAQSAAPRRRPPALPGSKPPSRIPPKMQGSPGAGAGTGVGAVKSVSSSVVEMQQAMIALANENYQAPPTGQPIDMDQYQKNKDFEDFMVESYSNGSNIKGEEWNPSVAFHTPGTRRPSDLIELSNVFNQLKKINSVSDPIKPDGRWGFRTQNGIKNIWAFADALIRVYEDFDSNLQSPEFTKQDLSQLGEKIPKTSEGADADVEKEMKKYSSSDLDERAKVIAPLVNKLTLFYRRFKKSILQNPIYKQFVESDEEGKYKTFGINIKPKIEDAGVIPDNLKNIDINKKYLTNITLSSTKLAPSGKPYKKQTYTVDNFPLANLSSSKAFQEFLIKELRYSAEEAADPDIQTQTLKELNEQISKIVQSNK